MIRATKTILFVVLICLVVAHFAGHTGGKPWWPWPVDPPPTGSVQALFTYNIDAAPDLVGSRDIRDWMDQHGVSYRFAGSTAKFGDDQPEFKRLMEQPRKADNWLYVHGGRLRSDDSVAMPADEAAAEKVIGRHAR